MTLPGDDSGSEDDEGYEDPEVYLARLAAESANDEGGPSEAELMHCLLYTSPSPRDATLSRMPSSA